MKIVQINTVCGSGSTGKICVGISEVLNKMGIENYILYSSGKKEYQYSRKCTELMPKWQSLKSRILGNYGLNSRRTTNKIIRELDRIQPDIVHLHNLHGHNSNLEILMDYFRRKSTKIIWTFHDCWAFTAYCPYFDMVRCDKWKSGCYKCPQYKKYSWFIDRSRWLYNYKKEILNNLDLTIVTPSQWLANLVKDSFLKNYPVRVINNGINLEIFRPVKTSFRKQYNIDEGKFIILGVADKWVSRKGADIIIRMARRLPDDKYQIVMVGTDDLIDKVLPDNIISIHRTENQQQLAEIYTAADVFINPTREENYPTVNMEAIACGTPVISFKTGGSPEIVDENTGVVVNCEDVDAMEKEIIRICNEKPFYVEDCVKRAKKFDMYDRFEDYVKLYMELSK